MGDPSMRTLVNEFCTEKAYRTQSCEVLASLLCTVTGGLIVYIHKNKQHFLLAIWLKQPLCYTHACETKTFFVHIHK